MTKSTKTEAANRTVFLILHGTGGEGNTGLTGAGEMRGRQEGGGLCWCMGTGKGKMQGRRTRGEKNRANKRFPRLMFGARKESRTFIIQTI